MTRRRRSPAEAARRTRISPPSVVGWRTLPLLRPRPNRTLPRPSPHGWEAASVERRIQRHHREHGEPAALPSQDRAPQRLRLRREHVLRLRRFQHPGRELDLGLELTTAPARVSREDAGSLNPHQRIRIHVAHQEADRVEHEESGRVREFELGEDYRPLWLDRATDEEPLTLPGQPGQRARRFLDRRRRRTVQHHAQRSLLLWKPPLRQLELLRHPASLPMCRTATSPTPWPRGLTRQQRSWF